MNKQKIQAIAAFDFDGTLIRTDSVISFLKWHVGKANFYRRALMRPMDLMPMAFGHRSGQNKLSLINAILGPVSPDEFEDAIKRFFRYRASTIFRPEALQAWSRHKSAGHECVIVTGSMVPLARPFALAIKADRLIGTEVEVDAFAKVLVALSPNCIRAEKLRRLKAVYGEDLKLYAAYGDTRGDKEMLAYAKHAYYRSFGFPDSF
jgi:phosphatidylglycerophosphatase C